MENANKLLKQYFGYEDFKKGQKEIISHILNGEDCLAIMPTGAGKSICYQIPALLFNGITIVISPLISLMKDQVDSLLQLGISATYINSSLSPSNYSQTIENASNSMYKIIYVAPERLNSDCFLRLFEQLDVSMIAIDEAHCVSMWGHDFRKSYTEISNFIQKLNKRPIITAFTATATDDVKKDIVKLLHLNNPFILTTGFDRENLSFYIETPEDKKDYLVNYLDNNKDRSGIIYCLTRKKVEELYNYLLELGYKVSKYHGGMSDKDRASFQEDFVYDKSNIMIATNAFGMGIDKSNIRYVIHFNMPKDIEGYYQEAGRAGRDGTFSECILLFSRADIVTNKFLISQSDNVVSRSMDYRKLNAIIDYCNTDKCLRKYILEYFGETPSFEICNNCTNCNSKTESIDITQEAKKILSCIKRMQERFGSGMVSDVLKGAKTSKIKSFGFDSLSTYGIMNNYTKSSIKEIIAFLISSNYINSVGDTYPILTLNSASNEILFGNKSIFIKRKIDFSYEASNNDNYNMELFNILKNCRKELAIKENIPPFVIFSDSTLISMCKKTPVTEEQMMNISGVGRYKYDKYGEIFINLIKHYLTSNVLPKSERNKKIKEDTKLVSYDLYKKGTSIEEIANIRGLTKQTIENHLLKCFEDGLDINLEKYVNTEFEVAIKDAIKKLGTKKLRPIKDILPSQVSYFDINYYIIKDKFAM